MAFKPGKWKDPMLFTIEGVFLIGASQLFEGVLTPLGVFLRAICLGLAIFSLTWALVIHMTTQNHEQGS